MSHYIIIIIITITMDKNNNGSINFQVGATVFQSHATLFARYKLTASTPACDIHKC